METQNFGGFLFPAWDKSCARVVVLQAKEGVPAWMKYVKGRQVCVQAGGNCGAYPALLSEQFDTVYTFEPDADNFSCLVANVSAPNVIKIQAALGKEHMMVGIKTFRDNVGAHHVDGHGRCPVLRIDDFTLPACDLIALDIEGYEFFALQGASETIEKFSPVIVIEDKGHIARIGHSTSQMHRWLEERGYKHVTTIHRDSVWTK